MNEETLEQPKNPYLLNSVCICRFCSRIYAISMLCHIVQNALVGIMFLSDLCRVYN